jgi:hypothetical protein
MTKEIQMLNVLQTPVIQALEDLSSCLRPSLIVPFGTGRMRVQLTFASGGLKCWVFSNSPHNIVKWLLPVTRNRPCLDKLQTGDILQNTNATRSELRRGALFPAAFSDLIQAVTRRFAPPGEKGTYESTD